MNFYEKFKADVDVAVKPLYDTVATLEKGIATLEKRLGEEKDRSEGFEQRIAALKQLSTDGLTSSRNKYEKFKTSMQKLTGQLSVSQEAIRIFGTEIIPRKKTELAVARQKAGAALYAFWVTKRPLCEELLTKLIDNIVTEYDGFLNSVSLSVQDYFHGNVLAYESPFSGVMNSDNMGVWPALCHRRINRNSWRINNKPPAQIAAKPVSLPEVPQNEPEGEQTPAEGIVLPSEAGSELVEAQPAPGEALETTPEPITEDSEQLETLLTGKVDRLRG